MGLQGQSGECPQMAWNSCSTYPLPQGCATPGFLSPKRGQGNWGVLEDSFWKVQRGSSLSWTKDLTTELTLLLLVTKGPVDVCPWTDTDSDRALHLETFLLPSLGGPPLVPHSVGGTQESLKPAMVCCVG